MLKGKRGQFYIMAAIIIIAAVILIATISNYAQTQKKPTRFYTVSDILELNGRKTIENAQYNQKNVDQVIEEYLRLFSDYLNQNTNIDFNLIIIYGSQEGQIRGKVYSRDSLGSVSVNIGGSSITLPGGYDIQVGQTNISLQPDKKTVDVVLTDGGKNITMNNIPILEDNNFIFVMTTNQGFNDYVVSNMQK